MSTPNYEEVTDYSSERTNTLGRKQLISMLKQRYGPEIECYRNSNEQADQEQDIEKKLLERSWDQRNPKSKTFQFSKSQYPNNNSSSMVRSNNSSFRRSTRRNNSNDGSGGETSNSVSGNSDNDSGWSSHAIAFLQYRDEVKRVNLPSLMRSIDTVKSLFVEAFPNKVTLQHFQTGKITIYIKDIENGVYYQLENIGDVSNRSFLKIHELDTLQTNSQPTWDSSSAKKQTEVTQEVSVPKFQRESSSSSLRSDGVLNRTNYGTQNNFEFKGDSEKQISSPKTFRSSSFNNAYEQYGRGATFSPAVTRKTQPQMAPVSKASIGDASLSNEECRNVENEDCINIKSPGKLNQKIINNLQNQADQFNSRKEYLPKHYQPTVLVKAQEAKPEPVSTKEIKKHGSNQSVSSESSDNYKVPVSTQPFEIKREEKTKSSASLNKTSNNIPDISTDLLQELNELEEEVKWKNIPDRKSQVKENKKETSSSQSPGSSNANSKPLNPQNTNAPSYNNPNMIAATTKARNTSMSSNTSAGSENLNSSYPDSYISETGDHENQADELLQSLSQPIYAQIDKAFLTSKAKLPNGISAPTVSVDESAKSSVQSPKLPRDRTKSGKICKPPSVTTPDFIELEDSAHIVKKRIYAVKKDLAEMRKFHLENSRQFKADIQKKLLLFRKKAAKAEELLQDKLDINNSFIFAHEHPVRERRHRLTSDQIEYNKKKSNTTELIGKLEDRMEKIRLSVVTKKCVENPEDLETIHDELTGCAKSLSEVKNRYHGLIDMVEKVITTEKEIISEEEKFLKE